MANVLDLTTLLYVDGAWTAYPSYADDGWSVQIGPDVETGTRPSKLTFTLQNPDLSMDPTNVSSALYGKIGRNTPARIRINGVTLTMAEASSWQPDRTPEHQPGTGRGRSWVDLTAEGVLRRLARWTEPLASPMRRQIGSYASLVGYWPLEDPSGAATLAAVKGGAATYAGTVTLGGDDGPGGSGECLTVGTDTTIRGAFDSPGVNGWQICWTAKLAAVPGSSTAMPLLNWTDSVGRTWMWTVNDTQFGIIVLDPDGVLLKTSTVSFGTTPVTSWIRFRVKATVSGSTVTFEPAWYNQDASIITGWSDTFSSSFTGRLRAWSIEGNTHIGGAAYAHLFGVTDTSLDLTGSYNAVAAFNGYRTELAGNRFQRLLTEQGLAAALVGSAADTVPMGRQKPGILVDLLTECAVTDGGLIYDSPLVAGELTMRTRRDMINRTPALTLARTDLAPGLRKVVDDVDVANTVTVTNSDGTTATATLTTGALSTAVPPAGVGAYKVGIDVSQSASLVLADRANWEMRKGTLDRPRYTAITVDLLGHRSLTDTVTAMRPGDWIALTGVEPDTVSLRVISIDRKGDAVRDTVTFTCLPAELWQVAVIDTSRKDSRSTTLASALTSTATSVPISTVNPVEVWSTTGVPYDIRIGGERMTVTACTTAAGTGPYTQTMTVTRSVNSVVKAQTSGAEVHLFDQRRIGLRRA
ncbi:hypothetical protein [Actinoplanes sp. NPDC051851]|uniref:hypothetical protein n=1 Tax=Actinoplanes sp. NPDC051851 TaxID=3154753 RepID=UPI0034226FD1